MGISDPGQDLSFSGAALTLLSALGSTEESSLFRTRRMNVLVSVNAPSATFREHFSVHRFSFRFSSWPRSPPTFGPPLSTLLCSSSDRGRREKKSLEHESRTSFRCCVDELSLGRSIVTPNGFRLLFGSSRLVVNHRFRVGECLLWLRSCYFLLWTMLIYRRWIIIIISTFGQL